MTICGLCYGCGRTVPASQIISAGPGRGACSPACVIASLPDLRVAAWR